MKKAIKKFGAIAAGLVLIATALTGCYSASSPGKGNRWFADEVSLPDGRTVVCVAAGAGGVHCDYDNAKGVAN